MLELLKEIDTRLFLFINSHYCSFCDFVFYWTSYKWTWIPFYAFLALVIYKHSGNEIWKIFISVAVLVLLTDQFSVFIKEYFMRYRPCHNLILQSQVHLVNGECGGQYGFLSSHAANSAGLAALLILQLRKKIKWITPLLMIWCIFISFSRIYLGVHYPLDIIGGWVIGFFLSSIIFYFYKKILIKNQAS